jgi:hypothetical protein
MFLFADNTNALSMGDNLINLIDFVNGELKKLALWFRANKLVINVSKTKYMIFRTRNRNVNMQDRSIFIDFNDNDVNRNPDKIVTLERVHDSGNSDNQTYKLLGILFDEFLTFNQHLQSVKSKLSRSIFLLNRCKNCLTKRALKVQCHEMVVEVRPWSGRLGLN